MEPGDEGCALGCVDVGAVRARHVAGARAGAKVALHNRPRAGCSAAGETGVWRARWLPLTTVAYRRLSPSPRLISDSGLARCRVWRSQPPAAGKVAGDAIFLMRLVTRS
jgi:hypothetical protein